jgi:hypothetical protein
VPAKCLACGAYRDPSAELVYPYDDDSLTQDEAIPTLLTVECESSSRGQERMAIMCHDCWHKLVESRGIDMWISQACWESLAPVTPFEQLPEPIQGEKYIEWNAAKYFPIQSGVKCLTPIGDPAVQGQTFDPAP